MPELPEVETIRRQLDAALPGRRIAELFVVAPKSFEASALLGAASARGRRIEAVRRRGKALIIDLDEGLSIVVHLKMTGQLIYVPATSSAPTSSHTRATIRFDDHSTLLFNDMRRFGRVLLCMTDEVNKIPLLARMGPEPLDAGFSAEVLEARLARHPGLAIKAALLDQSVVAGLGNIYVDEVLFEARVHPLTKVADLRPADIDAIRRAIPERLARSVELGGSTLRDYVDATGSRGGYLDEALVFNRSGQPCPVCAQPLVKIRVAGRGTHLCKHCQPLRQSSERSKP